MLCLLLETEEKSMEKSVTKTMSGKHVPTTITAIKIGERYLDRYNKLTNNKDGVAGWTGYYNAEGELVITSRYDSSRTQLPTAE